MSFKQGTGGGVRKGRIFNDYGADELRTLINVYKQLELLQLWTMQDVRMGREREHWTNAVVRRQR
jgi:hypothetical protein